MLVTALVTGLIRVPSQHTWGDSKLECFRRDGKIEVVSTSTKRARDFDCSRCPLSLFCLRGLKFTESYPETSGGSFNIVKRNERL